MGKVDELRALREARYRASQTGKGMQGQRPNYVVVDEAQDFPSKNVKRRLSRIEGGAAGAAEVGRSQPDDVTVCGHMSIGKKACVRPKGHPEKNHRYPKA